MSSSRSPSVALSGDAARDRTRGSLTKSRLLAAVGVTLYLASFFLWAVRDSGSFSSPVRGYFCAEIAFFYPWSDDGRKLLHDTPLEFFSIVLAGWINPLFIAAAAAVLWKPLSLVARILGVLIVTCIPFSWVVFAYNHLYPREGHIVWVAAMVVTLAATWINKPAALRGEREAH